MIDSLTVKLNRCTSCHHGVEVATIISSIAEVGRIVEAL